MDTRTVELEANILAKNDRLAAELRKRFAERRTLVVNILSSPGSGKTTLLEETLRQLSARRKVVALVGDQATENDAKRLARSGAPVRQITTGEECRLDAQMIERALAAFPEALDADVVFIENIGNLICPAEYDLGEDLRVTLLSVTEGEDKPLKYPLAFRTANLILITKSDIAVATGFERGAAYDAIRAVKPDPVTIELSARSGANVDAWIAYLEGAIENKRAGALAAGTAT